jgi:DNA-binding GntR family transcriptional regulator
VLQQMWVALDTDTDDAAIELDRLFHDTIFAVAGMPFLHDLIQQARRRSDIFRRAHVHLPGRSRVSTEEHAEVLAALVAGDRALVERLTREHLLHAAEDLIAYVAREHV